MWRVVVMVTFLGLGVGIAQAGEIDPDHFGTWAPLGQPCTSEPRIVVNAKEVVIYIHGGVLRYGNLDEDRTCASGASRFSIPVITTCVTPNWGQQMPAPFWLFFNPQEKRNLMDFDLLEGDPGQLPEDDLRFRKCRKGR
ncbi:MAG: hypothetical protein HQL45_02495 [Alphaproteobacteria bacterium]|nr:hypothetical protein [Alphaproteobacteria bacterium]